MKSYKNVVVSVGGKNLSLRDETGEDPYLVFMHFKDLLSLIASLKHRPNVVISSDIK